MKHLTKLTLPGLLITALLGLPVAVSADTGSGYFTDDNGLNCNYTSSYHTSYVTCTGYVHVSETYTCTYAYTWTCDQAAVKFR